MKKKDYTNGLPDPTLLKEEILKKYPRKVAKKRDKSMIINDLGTDQEILANVRTIPGIITQRGCTYAGCKGVVLGPTRDIVNITHGPIGCGFTVGLPVVIRPVRLMRGKFYDLCFFDRYAG